MSDQSEWIKLAKAANPHNHNGEHELADMYLANGRIDPGFVRYALDYAIESYGDGSYPDKHHKLEDFIAMLVLYAIAFGAADQPDVCARLVADHMASDDFIRYYT